MFARVTTFQSDPSRLDDVKAKIEALKDAVQELPGIEAVYSAWGVDGRGVVTAIYQSKADAEQSQEQVAAIWGELDELLLEPPQTDVFDHVERMA